MVISNCVINLTTNKENTFKEIYRILKPDGNGKMVISDLVTSKEIDLDSVNTENWCSCIDGALTKENYMDSIKKAGFTNIEILDEKLYMELDEDKDKKIKKKDKLLVSPSRLLKSKTISKRSDLDEIFIWQKDPLIIQQKLFSLYAFKMLEEVRWQKVSLESMLHKATKLLVQVQFLLLKSILLQ